MKKNFLDFRNAYGGVQGKKTLMTVPGIQDEVINRIQSRRMTESSNHSPETAHINHMHQRR
jgi:hypothetical protein